MDKWKLRLESLSITSILLILLLKLFFELVPLDITALNAPFSHTKVVKVELKFAGKDFSEKKRRTVERSFDYSSRRIVKKLAENLKFSQLSKRLDYKPKISKKRFTISEFWKKGQNLRKAEVGLEGNRKRMFKVDFEKVDFKPAGFDEVVSKAKRSELTMVGKREPNLDDSKIIASIAKKKFSPRVVNESKLSDNLVISSSKKKRFVVSINGRNYEFESDVKLKMLSDGGLFYPDWAVKNGIEGTVRLKLIIDRDGNVEDVEVIKAPPSAKLLDFTVKKVKLWRFVPLNNKVEAIVTIRYVLK